MRDYVFPTEPADDGWIGFIEDLRRLKNARGMTFRDLAKQARYDHSVLVRALAPSPARFPSWPVTRAVVHTCGIRDIEAWELRWQTARQEWASRTKRIMMATTAQRAEELQTRLNRVREVPNLDAMFIPNVDQVRTVSDFSLELRRLKFNSGLTFAELAVATRQSTSTLVDLCSGNRKRISVRAVQQFLAACNITHPDVVSAWMTLLWNVSYFEGTQNAADHPRGFQQT